MRKKVLIIILIFLLIFCLCACKKDVNNFSDRQESFKLETDDGSLIVEVNDIEKFDIDNSLGRLDIAYKDDSEQCSTVYFISKSEYKNHMKEIKASVKGGFKELNESSIPPNISTNQNTTKSNWNTALYSYTDLSNIHRYLYVLTSEDEDIVIFVESENSEDIARNIFSSLQFKME